MREMQVDLNGKVALVTGAASGLGEVLAASLARNGASVVITDLDGEAAAATARRLSADGTVEGMELDVSRDDHIDRAVAAITGRHGGVDILVNNAGLARGRWQECSELETEEWLHILHVNVAAPARLARACRPGMRARGGGVIVNQSSCAAYAILKSSYAVSKMAISALTVALASEFAEDNIRVNGIAPGMMTGRLPDDLVAAVLAQQAIQRRGEADDLVGALLYLCSPASSFMTGQTLIVDGGITARP